MNLLENLENPTPYPLTVIVEVPPNPPPNTAMYASGCFEDPEDLERATIGFVF